MVKETTGQQTARAITALAEAVAAQTAAFTRLADELAELKTGLLGQAAKTAEVKQQAKARFEEQRAMHLEAVRKMSEERSGSQAHS